MKEKIKLSLFSHINLSIFTEKSQERNLRNFLTFVRAHAAATSDAAEAFEPAAPDLCAATPRVAEAVESNEGCND